MNPPPVPVLLQAAACLALASGTSSVFADTIELVRGDYNVYAFASAHTVSEEQRFEGSSSSSSFSIGAQADAAYADPSTDLHTAHGAGGASWNRSSSNVLSAGVGGIAEAFSWGLDTAATGTGRLQLYFDLTSDVKVSLVYEGTYGSELYRLQDGGWQQVAIWSAWENFDLAQGSYRWDGGAGESVTGSSAYSSGMFFTMTVTPVPELPTAALALLGLGVLGACRKAR